MSLLQCMPYKEYKKALAFSTEQCEKLARLAGLRIQFANVKAPGELLMRELDKSGCDVQRYNQLASTLYAKAIRTYYRPKAKVAILVANDKYIHLSKLATPSVDCDSIGAKLRDSGFIVITIKNTSSCILKEIFKRVCDFIPEDSYAFIFYAGHGCEIGNIKCLLGVDCPTENIQFEHCISENHVMKELERCKLDLCVLIMDMCRVSLDRTMNPQIYESMSYIEEFNIHKNLLVSYSCQSAAAAYEVLQIECSTTIDCDVTYELKTGDTNRIVPGASQYVNALCTRLTDDLDISSMLDKVHADIEHSIKKQRAVKVQCGVDKRSLYDPVTDNTEELALKLQEVSNDFSDCCTVLKK